MSSSKNKAEREQRLHGQSETTERRGSSKSSKSADGHGSNSKHAATDSTPILFSKRPELPGINGLLGSNSGSNNANLQGVSVQLFQKMLMDSRAHQCAQSFVNNFGAAMTRQAAAAISGDFVFNPPHESTQYSVEKEDPRNSSHPYQRDDGAQEAALKRQKTIESLKWQIKLRKDSQRNLWTSIKFFKSENERLKRMLDRIQATANYEKTNAEKRL